ncbi:type II toxin-antitoxin system HicA family toxin [Candidatus Amarobacter glycogenicus]|uniref:type II toxin-antitoxin system HicA family toxin n=1 Tax=Candidatus Amarobacter glycogenicus TaxID=3140699 RepID=UPI0031367DCC|nr:type II toxin-antitoxin system HicA family toxin [Dehalococcoidia bacterium]MCC6269362.1 type II toxin-antitoxin system HicA family toxin [Dehalococcoidia bacterium]
MKRVNLVRHLTQHGCILLREGASHSIWWNPDTGQREQIPRHNEVKDRLAQKICRGLSVPPPTG